jgi:opacity protein-like surface antigen
MRVLATGFLLAALGCPAFAAEVVPPPGPPANLWPFNYAASAYPARYSWTGFYVGANAGYGFVSGTSTASIAGGLLNGTTATASGSFSGGVAAASSVQIIRSTHSCSAWRAMSIGPVSPIQAPSPS